MNITAITRFKHGDLYRLLKELQWTQTELAKRTNLSQALIGRIINLRKRPDRQQAEKIQTALAEGNKYLDILAEWPELFEGLEKAPVIEQTIDVDVLSLGSNPNILQIAGPNNAPALDLKEQVEHYISELPKRKSELATAMFIEELSDHEIAGRFGIQPENANAIRQRLRHTIARLIRGEEKPQDYSKNRIRHMIAKGDFSENGDWERSANQL